MNDNYWFLYNFDTGSIYGSPYKGGATEWTNVPEGCGILGFIGDEITDIVQEAFKKPLKYKVVNNELIVNGDYTEPKIILQPTQDDRILALENAISALMGV